MGIGRTSRWALREKQLSNGRIATECASADIYRAMHRAKNKWDESSVKKCYRQYYLCMYVTQDEDERSFARSSNPHPELLGPTIHVAEQCFFFPFYSHITLRASFAPLPRCAFPSNGSRIVRYAEKKRARRITDQPTRWRNINFINLPSSSSYFSSFARVCVIPEYERSSQAGTAIIM